MTLHVCIAEKLVESGVILFCCPRKRIGSGGDILLGGERKSLCLRNGMNVSCTSLTTVEVEDGRWCGGADRCCLTQPAMQP